MDRACGQWIPHAFRRRSIITTIAHATSTPVAANLVSRVGLDDRDDDVQGWHDGFGELRVECEEENGLMAQQERSSGSHAPAGWGHHDRARGRHQG